MSDYSSIDAGEVVAGYAVIEPLGVRQESGHRLLLAVHPRTQNHVVLKETDPNSYAREEMIYASGLAHDNILIPDQLFEAQQS